MYANAQYYKNPTGGDDTIRCDINGVVSYVPLDPSNTDYQKIMSLVEEGKLTIAEPESN